MAIVGGSLQSTYSCFARTGNEHPVLIGSLWLSQSAKQTGTGRWGTAGVAGSNKALARRFSPELMDSRVLVAKLVVGHLGHDPLMNPPFGGVNPVIRGLEPWCLSTYEPGRTSK